MLTFPLMVTLWIAPAIVPWKDTSGSVRADLSEELTSATLGALTELEPGARKPRSSARLSTDSIAEVIDTTRPIVTGKR